MTTETFKEKNLNQAEILGSKSYKSAKNGFYAMLKNDPSSDNLFKELLNNSLLKANKETIQATTNKAVGELKNEISA